MLPGPRLIVCSRGTLRGCPVFATGRQAHAEPIVVVVGDRREATIESRTVDQDGL